MATRGTLDRERIRNFLGLALSRIGPRAFETVHGTFLILLVGARTHSAFLAAFAISAHRLIAWLIYPIAGRLSDGTKSRFGRRTPYLGGGLIIMGLCTWSYTVLDGYWPLVAAIVVARVASITRSLAGIVVVPETFGRSRWLRAIIAIAIAGAIVSLILRVTVIATWDEADPATWNISFRMAAGFMIMAGFLVLVLVRDTTAARALARKPVQSKPWRERIGEILEVPNARLLLAGLFLTIATSGAMGRLVPLFYRHELGAGAAEQSTALLVSGPLGLITSIPIGIWLTRRLTRKQLAVFGPLVGAAGSAAHLLVTNIWQSVALGLVTGAFALGAAIGLAALLLQLLPKSGGMGERIGLAAGPMMLVGVVATYMSAIAIDLIGSYRALWLFPTLFGLANAALMTRLRIPAWSARVDVRQIVAEWSRRREQRRREGGDEERARRRGRSSLFGGEVDVDDVDASVAFEVARHALGNPYAPPVAVDPDEPEVARTARRVLGLTGAQGPADVAEVANLLHDDAVLVDGDTEYRGQPTVVEELSGHVWELRPSQRWNLVSSGTGSVSFQLSPTPEDGEVTVTADVEPSGKVVRIQRRVEPTASQRADDYAAALGYPTPRPVDLSHPDRRRRRRRVRLTLWVIARNLGGVLARQMLGRPTDPVKLARGLRRTFERLGAGYVKFGQLVASSPSMFGEDVANEFRTTLDAGPVVPAKQVRALIAAELGRPFDELFSSFDPKPLGRASIAVVHKATTVDGREVAVKVIRPGIEDTLATDLALMDPLFRVVAGTSAARLTGPLLQMLDGFRRQLSEELDLRNEAQAMIHYRKLLRTIDLPDVVVPEPVPELTSRRVLTMELLDGVAVDDLAQIEDYGHAPRPLVEQSVKAWFLTAVMYGTFHGDIHAGNLMILRDGRIAMIDWGIVGRLDEETHHFLRQLIAGSLGDESAWDDIATYFAAMFGPMLARAHIDAAELKELFRPQIEALLTRPFGEISLGSLITENQRSAAEADGEAIAEERQSVRARIRARRAQAAANGEPRPSRGAGGPGVSFNRGLYLLGKQLMYFERYGRMYMSDVSLLHDRDFFTQLLAMQEAASNGSASNGSAIETDPEPRLTET